MVDIATGNQRFERLLQKERVAIGERIERIDELGPDGLPLREDRSDHRLRPLAVEPAEGDLVYLPGAIEQCEEVAQVVADLIAAIGQHEQEWMIGDAAHQYGE